MLKKTFQKLRLPDAFKYKVPVLITSVYVVIWIYAITPATAYFYLFLSIVTITGIAGYAYLLNDWSDEEKDRMSGKKNATSGLSAIQRWGLLFLFGLLAVVPWFYFPTTSFTLSLLILELALFAAYSLPPLRLKEWPIAGVLVDSLYAHVVPMVLAILTFKEIAADTNEVEVADTTTVLVIAGCWQLFCGLRNILLHQEDDVQKDVESGTLTFATVYGLESVKRAVTVLSLLEGIFFCGLLLLIDGYLAIGWCVAYALFLLLTLYRYGEAIFHLTNTREFLYRFADDFYNLWYPLPVLVLLCFQNTAYLFLLAIHLLLLPNPLKLFISERFFNK